jgi:hypothetical protein
MNTSEVLNKAADLIEERGWVQGGVNGIDDPWGLAGGPVCLEGSIVAALGLKFRSALYDCPAYNAVAQHLDRKPMPADAPFHDSLWAWNDAPARTASEVIEVLRAAAVIEAAREQETAWATYTEVVSA